ncbi:PAS domain S-box protein [Chloroflexota bacterium]
MEYNQLIPLIALIMLICLAILVLIKGQKRRHLVLFSVFLFSMALWASLIYLFRSSPDIDQAIIWEKAVMPTVCLAGATFMHFSYVNTRRNPKNWLLTLVYVGLLVIMALSPSDLMVREIGIDRYGYYPISGPLFVLVPLYTYTLFTLGMVNFIKAHRKSADYEEKNSYLYIVIGVACFWVGAIADLASTFGAAIPPLSQIGNILFCLLASVAILRYHLLDIRVVIRKTTSYLLISTLVALPYVAIIFLIDRYLAGTTVSVAVYLLLLVLLALLLQPLWRWVQNTVDRMFYRKRYDHLQALAGLSQQTHLLTDLDTTIHRFAELIGKTLESRVVVLFVDSLSNDKFIPHSSFVNKELIQLPNTSLTKDGPLIRWLHQSNGLLEYTDIDIMPSLRAVSEQNRTILTELGAELLVPIKSQEKRLVGIMVVGKKLSEQLYSIEEKQLLATLSVQISLILENARLYQELKNSAKVMQKSEERLRVILESIPQGVTVTDLEAKILQVNPTVCSMQGYDVEQELIGHKAFELIAEEDHPKAMHYMQKTLETGYSGTIEFTLIRKNGSTFPAALSAASLKDTSGESVGFVAVTDDITQQKRAEDDLKTSQEQLRSLSEHLQQVREEERASLSREIHDELGQSLTAAQLDASLLADKLRLDQEHLSRKAETLSDSLAQTIKVVRRISSELRPAVLDDLGCVAAVEWLVGEFQTRTPIRYKLNIDVPDITMNREHATACFRIVQEALTNIARHSEATSVVINLKWKANQMVLDIKDNGKGITKDQINSPLSYGLIGMRERAHLVGAHLEIGGRRTRGTRITLTMPQSQ